MIGGRPCEMTGLGDNYMESASGRILGTHGEEMINVRSRNIVSISSGRPSISTLPSGLRTQQHYYPPPPLSCQYCIHQSQTTEEAQEHLKVHKPFGCPYCTYRCMLRGDLTVHIRVHTGEKPFVCKFCFYKTAKKSNLNSHVARMHSEHAGTADY